MEIFGVAWPDDMECSRCVCVYMLHMEEQNSTSEKRTFLESEDILVFHLTTL